MIDYRVKSIKTDLLIAHTGFEKPEAPVITDGGHPGIPLHHVCCLQWLSFAKVDDISYQST